MAADALGADPVELALLNAAEPGYVSPHGNRVVSCELKQSIRKAAELLGWDEKRANRKPYRGLGMGTTVHVSGKRHFGDYDGSSAVIKINEDGKVFIICGEGENGQGTMTVLCQIAAEELGVPYEDVSISQADTDSTTYCHGAYASRLTYIAGNAVKFAAAEVKRQLFETASELIEAVRGRPRDQGRHDLRSRRARRPERHGRRDRVGAAVPSRRQADRRRTERLIRTPSSRTTNRYGNESGAYNFGVQMAEVEVDPGDREGHDPRLRLRRGLRHRDQSDHRCRPAGGRDRAGDRLRAHGALPGRGRQTPQPELLRLQDPLHAWTCRR